VFPAAPALCVLCARAWFDVRSARFAPRHAGSRIGLHLIGPLVVAIGIGCGYFLVARLELPRSAIVVPVALTLGGVALTTLANVRGGLPPRAPWIVMVALLITYAGLVGFVMPALERQKVVDNIARWAAATDSNAEIATYRLDRWNPAFRFYIGRHVTFLESPAEARAFFDSARPFYCLMRKPAYDEFVAQGAPLGIALEQEGIWATSGRALWRQSIQPTHFVLATNTRSRSVDR